jgi:hypothetical protein
MVDIFDIDKFMREIERQIENIMQVHESHMYRKSNSLNIKNDEVVLNQNDIKNSFLEDENYLYFTFDLNLDTELDVSIYNENTLLLKLFDEEIKLNLQIPIEKIIDYTYINGILDIKLKKKKDSKISELSSKHSLTKEEKEKIKQRLRSLGYLVIL